MVKKITLQLEVEHSDSIESLEKTDQELFKSAQKACDNANAPYYKLFVGAAIRLADGEILLGCNQENADYPFGLCAERGLISWIAINRPNGIIDSIAIAARTASETIFLPIPPCGICGQAMLDYESRQKSSIRVLMKSKDGGVYILSSAKLLLPFHVERKRK